MQSLNGSHDDDGTDDDGTSDDYSDSSAGNI